MGALNPKLADVSAGLHFDLTGREIEIPPGRQPGRCTVGPRRRGVEVAQVHSRQPLFTPLHINRFDEEDRRSSILMTSLPRMTWARSNCISVMPPNRQADVGVVIDLEAFCNQLVLVPIAMASMPSDSGRQDCQRLLNLSPPLTSPVGELILWRPSWNGMSKPSKGWDQFALE